MNERDLSTRLEELANRLDEVSESDDADWFVQIREISIEIRKLSSQSYAPGNGITWDAVKPKSPKQGGYIQNGKRTPF